MRFCILTSFATLGAESLGKTVLLSEFPGPAWTVQGRAGRATSFITPGFEGGNALRVQAKGPSFRLLPPSPIPIQARTRQISLRATGTGKRDTLFAIVRDAFGQEQIVRIGLLDFREPRILTADTSRLAQMVRLQPRGLTLIALYLVPANPDEDCQITIAELKALVEEPFRVPADPFGPPPKP
ncbi:MAG: hypothetical protein JNM27_21535 [Leptospirales bacterium]|nr:hypothetical protein [Leptospirales bacterium]